MATNPLHCACRNGDLISVNKYLNDKEFEGLNDTDEADNTPFHYACMNGFKDIVELIMQHNDFCGLNDKNDEGYTPFLYACMNGHVEIIRMIMEHKEFNCLNVPRNKSTVNTPFLLACKYGKIGVIEELLRHPNVIIPDVVYVDYKEYQRQVERLIELYKKLPVITQTKLLVRNLSTNLENSQNSQNQTIDSTSTKLKYVKIKFLCNGNNQQSCIKIPKNCTEIIFEYTNDIEIYL
ncbi:MAG: hypothetical protein Terrestrivirus1_221 [Terrestrivirus sp.]|uniref:Uncharacterized protein n=1 Tax=Terrestrivirus sp. TaxID=2487775 RepID=A0A3G4ZKI2_9VIRU|nr:MAG: hypothetical protein Terrestrivirus1_221 [Terrestrivirus sp.]